ncbi:arsenate reductase (glutaredoxin) [Flagellimonas aquimarina]|jgi:arsenate reductase|uniref:Arsenate reductase (Glutaredoxin) n=1 Tax=Flagellimonas aquimarina TaxID=2201895 RepID=A0A316L482_9FLAO|nr:arsenate reductase (glutaredoxin) [Allomuricauda koreensis]PWL39063.1 arsenate reductase (glutaredoxin) [Allomuricauda koreensis]
MIKIYHNPRCRKSREGLDLLQKSGKDFETVLYLENVLSHDELKTILKQLGISAMELVRKNEAVWKEKYKGKTLSENEIIAAMVENPKLIERPIVVNGNKAVIGRPSEEISKIV